MTATNSCSLTKTVRDPSKEPSPRSLEEVSDQRWYEDNPTSESPSTHEKSPDYSFGEQIEKLTETQKVPYRTIEGSFTMIEEGNENDELGEGTQPIDETAEEISMPQWTPTAIDVINQYRHLIVKLCDGEIINAKAAKESPTYRNL